MSKIEYKKLGVIAKFNLMTFNQDQTVIRIMDFFLAYQPQFKLEYRNMVMDFLQTPNHLFISTNLSICIHKFLCREKSQIGVGES